jgi:O-succinylbenzoate synthase
MSIARSRKAKVEVGISIGIQAQTDDTLKRIESALAEGYRRIKLKIKPGRDVEDLRRVRAAFPKAVIMADANSAYTLSDTDMLRDLDGLNLLMIEQPLAYDDIYDHSRLQALLLTSICLDESLHTLRDVKLMHLVHAGRIVNLKPQRVGGLFESVAIHDYCAAKTIPLWVGGMLECGVGRAVSMALASLPGVMLPSDLSATRRYYNPDEDIATPAFDLNAEDSSINVPSAPGLGVRVDEQRLSRAEQAFTSGVK